MTTNNHPEMKTVVQSYIIEETAELIYDNEKLDQWNKQIEALGLEGQKALLQKDKSPIPFMSMNTAMINICECLCPRKVNVEAYNVTPIPVEILDLIALAKKEGYFEKIQIWYDEKSPDPFCIGSMVRPGSSYSWDMVYYLMGKWGDVKQSFEELKDRAIKRFKDEKVAEAQTKISEGNYLLQNIDVMAAKKMIGDTVNTGLPF